MCRWLLFKSNNKVTLADLVLRSENSLVKQSFDATYHPGFTCENNANFNADGFGVGWYYDSQKPPAVLRSITPAWNDPNLREVCRATESNCILGHVRAATPGAPIMIYNCHPFRHHMLLFQHNGHLEGFQKIRRQIRSVLPDHLYNGIEGSTDTEHIFALFLSHLKDCCAPSFTLEELCAAIKKTIFQLEAMVQEAAIEEGFSTFNFAVTDGQNVLATRYCDKYPRVPPPSLYYCYVKHSELLEGFCRRKSGAVPNQRPGDGSDQTSKGEGHATSPKIKRIKTQATSPCHLQPPQLSEDAVSGVITDAMPLSSPGSVMRTQQIVKHTATGETEITLSPTENAILIASEPLHHQGGSWVQIPSNVILTFVQGSPPKILPLKPSVSPES